MCALAMRLGMTLTDISMMPASEFLAWQKYNERSPIDLDGRLDVAAGVVASTVANVHRGKGQKSFKVVDFMAFAEKQDKSPGMTPAQIRQHYAGRVRNGRSR